uniref:Immunoglobulin lambda like polypeptide 1 n=1 Tax=Junco hyemalis TaxID=40217 RepID=A0A8C5JFW6_JUNHY
MNKNKLPAETFSYYLHCWWWELHRKRPARTKTPQVQLALSDPVALLSLTGQPQVAPTVHLFAPSTEEMESKGKATLVCLMENFYPGKVTVEWVADGQTITTGVETSQPQRQSNSQYMASSYLSMEATKWQSYNSVSCKVRHDAGNVEKTVNRSECY